MIIIGMLGKNDILVYSKSKGKLVKCDYNVFKFNYDKDYVEYLDVSLGIVKSTKTSLALTSSSGLHRGLNSGDILALSKPDTLTEGAVINGVNLGDIIVYKDIRISKRRKSGAISDVLNRSLIVLPKINEVLLVDGELDFIVNFLATGATGMIFGNLCYINTYNFLFHLNDGSVYTSILLSRFFDRLYNRGVVDFTYALLECRYNFSDVVRAVYKYNGYLVPDELSVFAMVYNKEDNTIIVKSDKKYYTWEL